MELTRDEKSLLILTLQMRICYIETGNVSLTAQDVANMKDQGVHGLGEVKALGDDQMREIIKMRDLIKKLAGS